LLLNSELEPSRGSSGRYRAASNPAIVIDSGRE
jgi:hypothetical protein